MTTSHTAATAEQSSAALDTLAKAVLERHRDAGDLALLGIQRRGVTLARDLAGRMQTLSGKPVPQGSLDITLYRDDWTTKSVKPAVGKTSIPFDVEKKTLILVDDVLYTGRTIRAALEALADFGRPAKIELLVLVDRGHRELPIHADYVGFTLPTDKEDRVDVLVKDIDGEEGIRIVGGAAGGQS